MKNNDNKNGSILDINIRKRCENSQNTVTRNREGGRTVGSGRVATIIE